MSSRHATIVDGQIGSRLREIRIGRHMTQEQLGSAVGLSFKQIRKYEHGENRISSSMLYYMAKALNVEICAFFETVPPSVFMPDINNSMFDAHETEQLVQQYYRIKTTAKRAAFLGVVRAIADSKGNI